MKLILCLMIIGIFAACTTEKTKQKEIVYQEWKSEFPLDTTINFQGVSSAAYGYTYIYPKTFIERIDSLNTQIDSTIFISKNGKAILKLFVEGTIERKQGNLTEEDKKKEHLALLEHKKLIEIGKHELAKNLKVTKVDLRDETRRPYKLHFIGQKDNKELIWAIELSEIPISGDLIFKNMYFEYPKKERKYYHPIGIKMLSNFGMY